MEREVTLQEVLEAREARVAAQQGLLEKYGAPVISFTMNIAGPVKNSALIGRGFREGQERLRLALRQFGLGCLWQGEIDEVTGPEALYAVDGGAASIKAVCVELEEQDGLGRLFDMDVLSPDGAKLDRPTERVCIVCGQRGKGCASRRVHSVEELQGATRAILEDHFRLADRKRLAALATQSLLDEVCTTPKPGLVDRANSGSHRDMDVFTFLASAAALTAYWEDCVEIGQATAGEAPEVAFAELRQRGKRAEREMFRATGGVNTHKGAIFSLGVICGAVGRLWRADGPCHEPETIAAQCGQLYRRAYEEDREAAAAHPCTPGERAWKDHGFTGIRGEVAGGFPSVLETALPALHEGLARGMDRNDAGAVALLRLIALGRDTNLVHRGGLSGAAAAVEEVRTLLAGTPFPSREQIEALDRSFIAGNLSPGGCADLLAVTLFFHALTRKNQ